MASVAPSVAMPTLLGSKVADQCLPCGMPPRAQALPPLMADAPMLKRMLDVIEQEVLPKTEIGVAEGNKVFGAAVLNDVDGYPTIIAETNHEMECPIYHGEVYTIKKLSDTIPQSDRPTADKTIFLSTHEPCCMCVSSIVWAGYKKCFYLFPYESTKDQGIPHDLDIMYELWGVPRYQQRNKFFSAAGILDQIALVSDETTRLDLLEQVARISEKYTSLSDNYHTEKSHNPNNMLAFN